MVCNVQRFWKTFSQSHFCTVILKVDSAIQHVRTSYGISMLGFRRGAFTGCLVWRDGGQEGWQEWCDTQGVKHREGIHMLLSTWRRELPDRLWGWCYSSSEAWSLLSLPSRHASLYFPSPAQFKSVFCLSFQSAHSVNFYKAVFLYFLCIFLTSFPFL